MNTCQDARTDRLMKAHSFLPPPPLSHLVLFFSTTPLFCCSVSETPCFVVCLPLTSAQLYRILPAPLSLPLVLSVLSAPSAPFSSLCPISVLFCLYLSPILSLPLFHSPSYLLVLSCSSSFFSPLFSSPRPENDFYLFSPLASANLWCWPAEKRTLQNNFHNPPAKLTKIYVSGWLAELPLANKSQCVCVCVNSPFMLRLAFLFFELWVVFSLVLQQFIFFLSTNPVKTFQLTVFLVILVDFLAFFLLLLFVCFFSGSHP